MLQPGQSSDPEDLPSADVFIFSLFLDLFLEALDLVRRDGSHRKVLRESVRWNACDNLANGKAETENIVEARRSVNWSRLHHLTSINWDLFHIIHFNNIYIFIYFLRTSEYEAYTININLYVIMFRAGYRRSSMKLS